MSTTTALFKKERHTAKWFLLGGILFFWSFPLLEGTGTYFRSGTFRTDMPSGMALAFGGLFAILTACGMVCMDMPKGLYEFWRSRPVKLVPYLAVKYVIGLAVVLFVITAPILLEIYLLRSADYPNSSGRSILCCHTFIILLIYSVAFCAGHLFRNMTEAAIISFTAALLVYFVPVLVPTLEPLSFFNIVTDGPVPNMEIVAKLGPNDIPKSSIHPKTDWGYSFWGNRHMYWMPISSKSLLVIYLFKGFWLFTGTMTALSVAMIVITWICLKYHLHIRLGLKSICWSLGVVALVLFSAAAFSVGSNLKCLAKISLCAGKERMSIRASCFDNKGGIIFHCRYDASKTPRYSELQIDRIGEGPSYAYRQESYPLETSLLTQGFLGDCDIAWSKHAPDIVYLLELKESAQANVVPWRATLYVIKLDDGTHTARLLSELPVGEYGAKEWAYYSDDLVLDNQTLYLLLPSEVVIFDVNDAKQPRLLAKSAYQALYQGKEDGITIPLPTDNALSEDQRYRIAQYFARKSGDWEGDRYVRAEDNLLCVYGLKEISSKEIQLEKIAERKSLPLEKLMFDSAIKVILKGDKVFLLNRGSSLMVYELNESLGTLKNIGHYAAPEGDFYDMLLRDDGLVTLIGVKQIHIIQPPATKKD